MKVKAHNVYDNTSYDNWFKENEVTLNSMDTPNNWDTINATLRSLKQVIEVNRLKTDRTQLCLTTLLLVSTLSISLKVNFQNILLPLIPQLLRNLGRTAKVIRDTSKATLITTLVNSPNRALLRLVINKHKDTTSQYIKENCLSALTECITEIDGHLLLSLETEVKAYVEIMLKDKSNNTKKIAKQLKQLLNARFSGWYSKSKLPAADKSNSIGEDSSTVDDNNNDAVPDPSIPTNKRSYSSLQLRESQAKIQKRIGDVIPDLPVPTNKRSYSSLQLRESQIKVQKRIEAPRADMLRSIKLIKSETTKVSETDKLIARVSKYTAQRVENKSSIKDSNVQPIQKDKAILSKNSSNPPKKLKFKIPTYPKVDYSFVKAKVDTNRRSTSFHSSSTLNSFSPKPAKKPAYSP